MRRPILALALCAVTLPLTATLTVAGPIERACLGSNRGAENRSMCSCIQQAADLTLASTDQRRAAKFFTDPDEAQRVRISDRNSDNAFWGRYKAFGQAAEAFCAG